MKQLKVLFCGNPAIAVPALQALSSDLNFKICGVVTYPDRVVGRKKVLTPTPVKAAATVLNLPIYEVSSKETLLEAYKKSAPDICIVIAFGMIFPASVLDIPTLGTVNVHFSLLPHYRGASPVQSALLSGDAISGITLQKMVKRMDAGDIIWSKQYPLGDMNTAQAWEFFAAETATYLGQSIQAYAAGEYAPVAQVESDATYCQKLTRADGQVHINTETVASIMNKFRAFTPFPGIYYEDENTRIKLLSITITPTQESVTFPCTDGVVHVEQMQVSGRKPMTAKSAKAGNLPLWPGAMLSDLNAE